MPVVPERLSGGGGGTAPPVAGGGGGGRYVSLDGEMGGGGGGRHVGEIEEEDGGGGGGTGAPPVARGGGGGGRDVGDVKEGGRGNPVSVAGGGGGGGGGGGAVLLGSEVPAGGGGALVSLELATVCREGTEGGGTAMPRLLLHSGQGGKRFQPLNALHFHENSGKCSLRQHRNYISVPKKL